MRWALYLAAAGLIGLLPAATRALPAAETATAQTQKTAVPKSIIEELDALRKLPEQPSSREETIRMFTERMEATLRIGLQAEREYPSAANLHEVQVRLLRAADFLASYTKDEAAQKQLLAVAGRILASGAPLEAKSQADYHLTRAKTTAATAADVDKEILALAKRYESTAAAAGATLLAAQLAIESRREKVQEQLIASLKTKHAEDSNVRQFLSHIGRSEGLAFVAELPRLDGGRLSLPKDLLGKVVVVEFWATWCPPCVAAVPHMKQLYDRHRSEGLEIVGISLDSDRSTLSKFVKDQSMGWIQTFTGMGWDDPTVRQYAVRATPTIWVIGRDGKIVSDGAMDPNASTLAEALAPVDRIVSEALKQPAPAAEQKK